jgi:hypothetical protein
MAINPVGNSTYVPPQSQAKEAGSSVNANNKVNHPAVAPQNNVVNDGDSDNRGVKKAAAVQPQESKSSVKQTINKFA